MVYSKLITVNNYYLYAMKIKENILTLLLANGTMSVHDLVAALGVSRQYIHRKINELEDDALIQALGKPPQVLYTARTTSSSKHIGSVDYEQEQFLNQHFLLVDAVGNLLEGLPAFTYWCEKQNLNMNKTLLEFIKTRKKYLSFYTTQHLIDGTLKLKNTKGIGEIGVDTMYYLDFYAIERFGKTRLGTLMHYAKQGQNRQLMKKIVDEVQQRVYNLIQEIQVDAVLFVPPTIDRKIQIMGVLEKLLAIDKPILKIRKIRNKIVVPQKALSNIFERITNAKNTFYLPPQKEYGRILLIDDAVGSGATMNEIALKLKDQYLAKEVFGLAITGSYKGFEVISEL